MSSILVLFGTFFSFVSLYPARSLKVKKKNYFQLHDRNNLYYILYLLHYNINNNITFFKSTHHNVKNHKYMLFFKMTVVFVILTYGLLVFYT